MLFFSWENSIHATTTPWNWVSRWKSCHSMAWISTWNPISRSCSGMDPTDPYIIIFIVFSPFLLVFSCPFPFLYNLLFLFLLYIHLIALLFFSFLSSNNFVPILFYYIFHNFIFSLILNFLYFYLFFPILSYTIFIFL